MNTQIAGFIFLGLSAIITVVLVAQFRGHDLRKGKNSDPLMYSALDSCTGALWVGSIALSLNIVPNNGYAILMALGGLLAGGLMGAQLRGDAMKDRWGYRTSEAKG